MASWPSDGWKAAVAACGLCGMLLALKLYTMERDDRKEAEARAERFEEFSELLTREYCSASVCEAVYLEFGHAKHVRGPAPVGCPVGATAWVNPVSVSAFEFVCVKSAPPSVRKEEYP